MRNRKHAGAAVLLCVSLLFLGACGDDEVVFFGGDRIDAVREMILADDETGRRKALAKLLPMQRNDFLGIFRVMGERPVTIRLPTTWFGNLKQAFRDLATIVQQMLKDDAKPARWDDVWMLGNAIASVGNPKPPVFDETQYAYRFTSSATNIFGGCIQMPHRMRIDGPDPIIGYPHLHIYTRTAVTSTASGKHVWRLRWRWYDAVGTQTATWNVRTVTHTASRTGQMAIASSPNRYLPR